MAEMTDGEAAQVDLAVVAYRDEDDWSVQVLAPTAVDSVELIVRELRRYPGETGALAMVCVDDEFLLLVRVTGTLDRVLLSDASAAADWTLARDAIEHLGLHIDDEDDEVPAGDLGIVADMGLSASDLTELLDDDDLYLDEILSELAGRLGFGERFDELAGLD